MTWREKAAKAIAAKSERAKAGFVSFVSSTPAPFSPQRAEEPEQDYTAADLVEIDTLLRELAQLEGWTSTELEEQLDQRRRMAPARVAAVLGALRAARREALAPWPERPAKRSSVELCVLTGGKQ